MDSKSIIGALQSVTKVWAKQRKSEERQASNKSRRSRAMTRCSNKYTLKAAAHEFIESAYLKASANNTLPANARQIMYAARGPIQDATGETLDDKYFTQTLLPEFMRSRSLKTKDWDVVFDARGHFHEPHTRKTVNLGTIAVRQYLGERPSYGSDSVASSCPLWPTSGPKHRFSAVLFLEKEGFNPLLEKVELAKRFDIGVMSTKGMSVTAARLLVDRVCGDNNIPLLVLHDFDKAGFSILGTLTRSSDRYRFKNKIKVKDLGLRLQDVEEMELESESVSITDNDSTRRNLVRNGATDDEINFLMEGIVEQIKQLASGKWDSILSLDLSHTEAKGQPCPMCKGEDRFHVDKEYAANGRVRCRQCLEKRSGDGIATYAWSRKIDNSQAIKELADLLGVTSDPEDAPKIDLIEQVARSKRMPLESFRLFNPIAETRGKLSVARVGVYNGSGEVHSYFDITSEGKGLFKRGDGNSGMFFPGRLPQPGESWCIVEGVKDAAALIAIGFNAAGLPTSYLADKYARLFDGVAVTCVADLDTAGQHGVQRTGANLFGIASSIRIARLPGEVKASGGEDVRDVLRRPNGEQLVREAIANSQPWEPTEGEAKKDDRPEVMVTLNEGFVADQVVKHLGKLGWESPWVAEFRRESVKVFSRGGVLVHTVESEDPITKGLLTIKPIPAAITRERITQSCQLLVEEMNGEDIEIKPTSPTSPTTCDGTMKTLGFGLFVSTPFYLREFEWAV